MSAPKIPEDAEVVRQRLLAAIDGSPLQAAFPTFLARIRDTFAKMTIADCHDPAMRVLTDFFLRPDEFSGWMYEWMRTHRDGMMDERVRAFMESERTAD